MMNICCVQLLGHEDMILVFVKHDGKPNIFGFGTVGQTKQDIGRCHFSLKVKGLINERIVRLME